MIRQVILVRGARVRASAPVMRPHSFIKVHPLINYTRARVCVYAPQRGGTIPATAVTNTDVHADLPFPRDPGYITMETKATHILSSEAGNIRDKRSEGIKGGCPPISQAGNSLSGWIRGKLVFPIGVFPVTSVYYADGSSA